MYLKKITSAGLLLAVLLLITAFGTDISDKITAAIKSGNAKQVASFFNPSIDLTVADQEDVYSKAQAELILKDFFTKHPPKSFSVIHQGTSKLGLQYAIGNLVTSNGNFRVSFYIKTEGEQQLIQQLRIDPE